MSYHINTKGKPKQLLREEIEISKQIKELELSLPLL